MDLIKMVKISKVQNVAIAGAVKTAPPLSDEEYAKLDKILKTAKDLTVPIAFNDDAKSDVIVAKIPDSLEPSETKNKDGKISWRIPLFLPNEKMTSYFTTVEDKDVFITHMGCNVAFVAKLIETPDKEDPSKVFYNLRKIRGCTIIESPDVKKKPAAAKKAELPHDDFDDLDVTDDIQ